ncbi:hypothetical protein TM5383_03134 [Thalassovita mediterranea]|jgi:hypothetical protein|uniref:Uncharacterized protein n=1 Tax=Thalassovita mediterranea TaxID=340021 RepID=A0A0N7M2E6_9RHOB|nr:hypothetical protein TM5383_03134 [Thalassovita mediterranea]SIS32744.1 hypothetical protein SAMN05421685_10785 [Thalassovita mediterranea]
MGCSATEVTQPWRAVKVYAPHNGLTGGTVPVSHRANSLIFKGCGARQTFPHKSHTEFAK